MKSQRALLLLIIVIVVAGFFLGLALAITGVPESTAFVIIGVCVVVVVSIYLAVQGRSKDDDASDRNS